MGILCVKNENLLYAWAKKRSMKLLGGLNGGKIKRILCRSVCMVQKKVSIF
jgi:hypothetical protein